MNYLVPERLETERLILRMFEESDWNSLHHMFSDPEAVKYTVKTPVADWQTWRYLAAYLGHWKMRGYGPYAVTKKDTGEMIGPIGLWYPGDWPEPEIKYSLAQAYWGNGYAVEAARAVQEMAFTTLSWKRLVSLVDIHNENSKKVAQKIGGVLEKTIPFRDTKADVFVYSPR